MGNKNNKNNKNVKINKKDKQKFKLKDFNDNENSISIVDKLNELFKGFRCIQCLYLLYFKITNNRNDNGELLIETKCKNNHIEIKTINETLNMQNPITFTNEFIIQDTFYKNRNNDFSISISEIEERQKDPFRNYQMKYLIDEEENCYYQSWIKEYFYICNKCKIIFYNNKEDFIREHPTYKYNYKGNIYDGKSTKYYLEYENKKNTENKINIQNNYYEKIKNIIINNNIKDKVGDYLYILSNEIKFINEINKYFKEKNTKYNYDNFISIIYNIKLYKFDSEKYKNFLNDNLISEINNINKNLEKNENIKYYSSGRISLLNYKLFELILKRNYNEKNKELYI